MIDDQWCVSQSECFECGKEWTAVHPLDVSNLECPECRSHDTARFEPDAD